MRTILPIEAKEHRTKMLLLVRECLKHGTDQLAVQIEIRDLAKEIGDKEFPISFKRHIIKCMRSEVQQSRELYELAKEFYSVLEKEDKGAQRFRRLRSATPLYLREDVSSVAKEALQENEQMVALLDRHLEDLSQGVNEEVSNADLAMMNLKKNKELIGGKRMFLKHSSRTIILSLLAIILSILSGSTIAMLIAAIYIIIEGIAYYKEKALLSSVYDSSTKICPPAT